MLETIILGGGAAGTGPLVHAARAGLLHDWLAAGIALVERADQLGGSVGQYDLSADTVGGTFLECLQGGDPYSPLRRLRDDAVTQRMEAHRDGLPPLPLVGCYLANLGACLADAISRVPASQVMCRADAQLLRLMPDGSVQADLALASGRSLTLHAASAIVALGGRPAHDWQDRELAPGLRLDAWAGKVMPADALLRHDGAARASRALARHGDAPCAVVLGASHSAFSAAWTLLHRCDARFDAGGVTMLHRSPPRVFYASRAEAAADGYRFGEADVCPATGRVNRLGGLRGDGRALWRRMHGLDGPADTRLRTASLIEAPPGDLRWLLDRADLIVPAFGYRLAMLPIVGADGRRVPTADTGPSVDAESRLLGADGAPIANVFGIGLGSGFRPWGELGGEPSFRGQQNSLWLYQNGLGRMVHDAVRRVAAERSRPRAAMPARGLAEWLAVPCDRVALPGGA